MAELTIVYWRDIPAQVIVARSRRDMVKRPLAERFEQAIDKAAMKGKASSTDDYLADWRKEKIGACDDDLDAVAEQQKAALEEAYDEQKLTMLIANAGYAAPQ